MFFLRDDGDTEIGGFGIAAGDDLLLVEDEETRLEKRKETLNKEMLAKVRGIAVDDPDGDGYANQCFRWSRVF